MIVVGNEVSVRVDTLGPVQSAAAWNMIKSGLQFSDCYGVQYAGNAALVEPINGDPFVVLFDRPYVMGGDVRAVQHVWSGQPRSGTGKLVARIAAQAFFDQLVTG